MLPVFLGVSLPSPVASRVSVIPASAEKAALAQGYHGVEL